MKKKGNEAAGSLQKETKKARTEDESQAMVPIGDSSGSESGGFHTEVLIGMPADAVKLPDNNPVTVGAMREIQKEMMQGMMMGMRGMMEDMMSKYVGGFELKTEVEIQAMKESIEDQQREIRAAASLASAANEAAEGVKVEVKKLTDQLKSMSVGSASGGPPVRNAGRHAGSSKDMDEKMLRRVEVSGFPMDTKRADIEASI